ncbi:MAG: methionyl-tRNA formyltransferase [Clostridia bacterium]|nr:methionyl-tRNA formyltransferase [Clostridia bacterium]
MRIVFMGTPDYSVKTLDALMTAGHEVVAVFAQPDKPVGRKQILTPPPVKQRAEELGIPCYQPTTLRDGVALSILKELDPEVIVVVAYGKILPKEILELPPLGCVNGHASLLPRHRGASPIQWAIVCGDKQTGVTTMLMDEGMDTGDILDTAVTDIGEQETAEELFERLSAISANLMVSTLKGLQNGTVTPKKQDENKATYAPIIKKEMAHIDFNKTADEICNAVRGYYSWPCAFCILDGKRLKVMSAISATGSGNIGEVIDNTNSLKVACKDGAVEFLTVQLEGSRAMSASEMLRGKGIALGTVLV